MLLEQARDILAEIAQAAPHTPAELEQFRIRYLGSKNVIKALSAEIRHIPNEQKRDFGRLINEAMQAAEIKYQALKAQLEQETESQQAAALDLSAPAELWVWGTRHPISITINRVIRIFERLGFVVAEDREIEDDWHNFTALNTPEDHPARDMQDTFYLRGSQNLLLRTHTSSVQVRLMEVQKPPIRIIAPGRVYRNETISARSHCQFHQVEGLYVDEGVSFADLKQTLLYFAQEMFGATQIRLRPSFFPFTEPSAEMDVYLGTETEDARRLTKGTGWLEILGCGMVDPNVLANCNIDPEKYTGFAFGMGIERQAMRLFGISDIRLLFENDVRFLRQFATVV